MTARTPGSAGGGPSATQPSLLLGFPEPVRPDASRPEPAHELPVARVCVESPLPQLDRLFDYLVPEELSADAQPGVRVRIRLSGQELSGFIIERAETSDAGVALQPLTKVVSPAVVLTPAVARLAAAVAERWAGALGDVLRFAVPPRAARVEAEYLAELAASAPPAPIAPPAVGDPGATAPKDQAADTHRSVSAWAGLQRGPAFLRHLAAGGSPRASLEAVEGYGPNGWPALVAEAVRTVRLSGRGALVVVPDRRDLDRACDAIEAALPGEKIVRLAAEDGPSQRYRAFLDLLAGRSRVAVGTRGAALAPVRELGLVVCWDDGDDLHAEPRAPYFHAREVGFLRTELEDAALLVAGHTVTSEVQRVVDSGWLQSVSAPRPALRARLPRVVSTADSFESSRDPFARIARLPHAAWQAARDALARGPVLVQVARAGYAPSLACELCREPARCAECSGPLAETTGAAGHRSVACRWCGTPATAWSCPHCGGRAFRRASVGALRTAEELGRAFPGAVVLTSSGDQVKPEVPDSPALVVATVGAEPVAPSGYAAALLLDGDSLLGRESLRAGEEALRRWMNAAALVRPSGRGGVVVITARDHEAVSALVRWDPAGFAARELGLRRSLSLPPSVRIAAVTGSRSAVEGYVRAAADVLTRDGVRTAGPVPLPAPTGTAAEDVAWQLLVFFPIGVGLDVSRGLRAARIAQATRRGSEPIRLRLDGADLL
ncbi:primosomal protein N' [Sinomonas sp. ASV322]|uniref:primosomal protein N' family DNA-binding protein n=1 Tax=Sinomonas sp. ASV322 TaxID=3041920 RepID=UPI0027DCA1E7|nr:primosomal protein N' [Sinomonas sp. ASV322]MDQ4501123.1 primosomal protein N' [Sinomonas sp. ASV322]